MSRTSKILGFSVPPALVTKIETLAKEERRTKSELFREMVRVYQRFRYLGDRDEEHWVEKLVQEAKAEKTRKPMTVDEILAESEEFSRKGAAKAKKLGVKTGLKSATQLIHERRKTRTSA